jgi:Ca2+-binding EF-hand superfamily protein
VLPRHLTAPLRVTHGAPQASRYSAWDQLRAELDENQDGKISLEEFFTGIKKMVLKQAPLPTFVPSDHSQAMSILNEAMNRTLKKALADYAEQVGMKGDAKVDRLTPQPIPNHADFEKPLMLTEGTMKQIQMLWLILDKTGDGEISPEDFLALAGPFGVTDHQQAMAKWQEMSKHFDTDHSGDITPFEFIDGFKKMAMGSALDWEGIKSMPEQTYLDVQAKLNESVNRRLQNLVKEAHEMFSQDVVPPTSAKFELDPRWNTEGWKQVSTRLADQLLINTENEVQIEEIFNHLDQTNDGVLTKEDFGPRSGEVSLRESRGPLPFGRRPPPPARRSRRGRSAAQLAPARLRAASGCCLGI